MKYYLKEKTTGEKYIVLNQIVNDKGEIFLLISNLKERKIIKINENQLKENYYFDGIID